MTIDKREEERIFSCDFCVPLTEDEPFLSLTNPAEWVRGAESASLLRLCGVAEDRFADTASDYEFLSALCESLPMLLHHPVAERFVFLCRTVLGIDPRAVDAATLWREGSAWLAEHAHTPTSFVQSLGSKVGVLASVGATRVPSTAVLSAETLSSAVATEAPSDWAQWESVASAKLSAGAANVRAVRIVLPKDFCYRRPSRYSADAYLKGKDASKEAKDAWGAQELRFFAAWAREKNIPWLLFADGVGEEAVRMLSECERAVGLPRTVWIAEDDATAEAMIGFAKAAHTASIERALPLLRYPSTDELRRAIERAAARTPLGRLLALTGGAWYAVPYERERYLSVLSSL